MRYFKNSSWMLGEQMLRMLAGLLVGIWVARYLGPEQFGIFSYVLAFTALFSSIAKLGLDGIMVRELVNHPDRQDVYLGTAFWMKVFGAFLVMALIALVLPWTNNDSTTTLYIFIIASGLVFQSFEVVDFYFQSKVLAKFVSICKVIQLTLSSLLKIYLVLTGAELIWFVWVILFDQITLAVTLFFAYRHQNLKLLPVTQFDYSVAKIIFRDSLPLMLSSIVVIFYMRLDQLIIKQLLGVHELGIYSSALKISEIFSILAVVISASMLPLMTQLKNSQQKSIRNYNIIYGSLIWTALAISLFISLFSNYIIEITYGLAYKDASDILSILIWSNVFIFIGILSHNWFIIENAQRITLMNTTFALIISTSINLTFASSFGLIGIAVTNVLSHALAAYIFNIINKKTRSHFYIITKAPIVFLFLIWKNHA